MSGFDKSWLALREPADLAARDPGLVEHIVGWLRQNARPVIVDIGCGTGSSVRALGPMFPSDLGVDWRLVDYDPALLREARLQLGDDGLEYHQVDLNHLENLPLEGASVLSASAFFDLASARFCEEIAALVAKRHCAFYAALNYDGKVNGVTLIHSIAVSSATSTSINAWTRAWVLHWDPKQWHIFKVCLKASITGFSSPKAPGSWRRRSDAPAGNAERNDATGS